MNKGSVIYVFNIKSRKNKTIIQYYMLLYLQEPRKNKISIQYMHYCNCNSRKATLYYYRDRDEPKRGKVFQM